MIKEAIIGVFSQIDPVLADRHYFRFHGPEVVYVTGPWLRRYVTYRTYEPPDEAVVRFGAKKGRYTELWFTSMEEYKTRPGPGSFSDPPWGIEAEQQATSQASLIVPAVPTEDFLGKEPRAEETTIMRWICAIRYPKEVSVEEGEEWYLNVHVPEVNRQSGLLRHISFRALEETMQPPEGSLPGNTVSAKPWIRMSELWYKDLDTWRKALIESPIKYTSPPWGGEYPYVEMLSNFVHYRYDVDFLKGNYIIP